MNSFLRESTERMTACVFSHLRQRSIWQRVSRQEWNSFASFGVKIVGFQTAPDTLFATHCTTVSSQMNEDDQHKYNFSPCVYEHRLLYFHVRNAKNIELSSLSFTLSDFVPKQRKYPFFCAVKFPIWPWVFSIESTVYITKAETTPGKNMDLAPHTPEVVWATSFSCPMCLVRKRCAFFTRTSRHY